MDEDRVDYFRPETMDKTSDDKLHLIVIDASDFDRGRNLEAIRVSKGGLGARGLEPDLPESNIVPKVDNETIKLVYTKLPFFG